MLGEVAGVGREGVVKMGDGCDIPRVAGHGARKEGESDINEVGDNQIDELLRKPGDWGRAQGRRSEVSSKKNWSILAMPRHKTSQQAIQSLWWG